MIELSLRKQDEEVMKYFLNKETTAIGRSSQNDICLPDASISRIHLTITRKSDQFFITDRSTNGTFVNDQRISSCALKQNDVIRLGNWTILFGMSDTFESADTQVANRDPTKVLSFKPDKNELIFERAILQLEGSKRRTFPISKSMVSVGKSNTNDITIKDDFVSNFHCKIEHRGGEYFLKDLNSTNGTKLNGQRIIEASLPFESTIELGRVILRFFSAEEVRPIEPDSREEFDGIHSRHTSMRKVFTLIDRVANSDTTVLIQGESGTGKELVARSIHRRSARGKGPFVAINCGAISRDLIESELFGHEKGAFTSAHQQRRGVFEQAKHGTLFLDEIGDMPLNTQAKILRVLQEREFKRVGGTQLIDIDVRIVAASNRDLALEVKKGRFREDLYFRLYVVPILLPPLRERPTDIPLLVDFFLEKEFASGKRGSPKKIDSSAMDNLLDHSWPGNVRELKNVISRAILDCQTETISPGDLQFSPLGVTDATAHDYDTTISVTQTITRTLKDVERERILAELERHDWNKKTTAEVLGIAKSTLHEKIRKYDLKRK